MALERINPAGLPEPLGYTQVVVATGTRRIYVAGQTGVDADGKVVSDDHAGQAAQAFRNVGTALEAAGAGWGDVAQMNILVVGHSPEVTAAVFGAAYEVFGGELPPPAASTYYGVQALFEPEHLIEIDVTAEVE